MNGHAIVQYWSLCYQGYHCSVYLLAVGTVHWSTSAVAIKLSSRYLCMDARQPVRQALQSTSVTSAHHLFIFVSHLCIIANSSRA